MSKIKILKRNDFLMIFIIIFVATASFGLGRLSVTGRQNKGIRVGEIELPTVPAAAYSAYQQQQKSGKSVSNSNAEVLLVASRNGSVFHFPWCPGAKQMKEENKVYFDSYEAARAAGYRPAANCPGLE